MASKSFQQWLDDVYRPHNQELEKIFEKFEHHFASLAGNSGSSSSIHSANSAKSKTNSTIPSGSIVNSTTRSSSNSLPSSSSYHPLLSLRDARWPL